MIANAAPHENRPHAFDGARPATALPAPSEAERRPDVRPPADSDEPTQGPTFWRRAARVSTGAALIIVGVLELFLPGPGILFIGAGLTLLAPEIPFVRRGIVAMYRRWPRLRRLVPRRLRHTRRRGPDS